MKEVKKVELVQIFSLIKSGLSPSKISKDYKIPKGTLAYHLDKLKKEGCIEKVGYGTWKIIRSPKQVRLLTTTPYGKSIRTSPKKEIRGHAFIWKIEFVKGYDWKGIIRRYTKKKLCFQLMKHNKVYRTIFNNRKIWLTKKGVIIYEPIDFLGKSSFEVKGKAVFQMDLLIKGFLKELNLKFLPYRFTTSREHYGIVKNELARQYNDRKEKMNIRSEDGDLWMWIDDSMSLGELENNEVSINRQVQQFWNNHKKHGFKIDADFILNTLNKSVELIKGNAEQIGYYGKNVVKHVKLMERITERIETMDKRDEQFLKILRKNNL